MTERLTKAELDYFYLTHHFDGGDDCVECGSVWPCEAVRLITELRELRAREQQHNLHDCATENEHELRDLRDEVDILELAVGMFEENARLRAALDDANARTKHFALHTGPYRICEECTDDRVLALASVRGDA